MSNLLLFGTSWIHSAFYKICLAIDGIIYTFVAITYRVFVFVAEAQLFGDNEIGDITNRIYVILGIAMLFVFAYNILTFIADPDKAMSNDDKSLAGLAKNLIISIVLLALLPVGFAYLQKFQNSILHSDVIGHIILGTTSDSSSGTSYDPKAAGTDAAVTIFGAFYHPLVDKTTVVDYTSTLTDSDLATTCKNDSVCSEYLTAVESAKTNIDFTAITSDDTLMNGIDDGTMQYYYIISGIAGIVAAYLFLSFSLDVGVRVAKLAVLEIIAPIPVVARIFKPKGGLFDRWVGEMSKTYMSLFMRLFIVYFAMYAISLVPSLLSTVWQDGNETAIVKLVGNVIIIFGILKFAKDAPKYFEDLFKMEHVQVGIKKKLGENEYAMRGMAMAGGALTSGVGNVVNGIQNHKSFAKTALSGAGGLIGGARQGLKQSEGLNDVSKLGRTIRMSKGTADYNRQQREDYQNKMVQHFDPNNELENKYIAENKEGWMDNIRNNHPDWSESAIQDEYNRFEGIKRQQFRQRPYKSVLRGMGHVGDTVSDFGQFIAGKHGANVMDAKSLALSQVQGNLKRLKELVTASGASDAEKHYDDLVARLGADHLDTKAAKIERDKARNEAMVKILNGSESNKTAEKGIARAQFDEMKKIMLNNAELFDQNNFNLDKLKELETTIGKLGSTGSDGKFNVSSAEVANSNVQFDELFKTINNAAKEMGYANDTLKSSDEWKTAHEGSDSGGKK